MSAAFNITARQSDALAFIVRYIAAHGTAPSYSEIRSALELRSQSGVSRLVDGLVQRGLLMKLGRSHRSLTLITEPACALPVRVHARLAAYCADHAERFEDVLADAVDLFLERRQLDLVLQQELDAAIAAGGG